MIEFLLEDIDEGVIYFVDRIGKFGSHTYVCRSFAEVLQKMEEIS